MTLYATLKAAGFGADLLPDRLEPQRFYRMPAPGRKKSDRTGWVKVLADGVAVYGDWSTGEQQTWHAEDNSRKAAPDTSSRQAERQREAMRRMADQQAAAVRARHLWESAKPANGHAYLSAKGVQAHGLRVDTFGVLLIPVYHAKTGELVSIQRIDPRIKDPDQQKRFLSGTSTDLGCYCIAGELPRVFCEGYATGATVHEATGRAVVVAFNADNLPKVAAVLAQAGDVVAADNDNAPKREERFGKSLDTYGKGHKVAMATGLPFYLPHTPGHDWNDAGHEATAQAFAGYPQSAAPVLNAWELPRLDVTGETKKQLFDKLAKAQDCEQAAAMALAVALRLFLAAPAQESIAGIRASIEAALPHGLVHPATLDAIAERLAAGMEYRKAAALAQVSIPSHALARHKVERLKALPTLTAEDYQGVIVLHAPMGSGKTRSIGAPFIAWAKAQGLMPLAICHRVSLVSDMAKALGLEHYADIDRQSAWNPSIDGLAVCLPSITSSTYAPLVDCAEIVFIDEVSQVLRFLAAADHCRTKEGNSEAVYQRLRELVSRARCVMVADAGCDERTLSFLESCRPGERFRVLEMAPKAEGIEATYSYGMNAPAAVVAECLVELASGGRVWIATESARRAKVLGAYFEAQGYAVMAVHSENKGNKAQAAFLADPDNESRRFDVVIASPVIGSGLSIEHKATGEWFTLGAYIGGGHSITPADAAQALRRVRYLRRYALALIPNSVTGRQSARSIELAWTQAAALEGAEALPNDFTELVASIHAADTNARADFAAGLLWQLEAAKWSLRRGEDTSEETAATLKALRAEHEEQYRSALLAAPKITDFEAERLKSKPARTESESITLEAWRIRHALGIYCLDAEALDFWDDGAAIAKLDRFSAWRGIVSKFDDTSENLARRRFRRAVAKAYTDLFQGITLEAGRITEEIAGTVLDRMIAKRHLLAELRIVPKTYSTWSEDKAGKLLPFKRPANARQELAEVLRRMGLEWKAVTVRIAHTPALSPLEIKAQGVCKPATKNARVYVVKPESVALMQTWAERRNSRRPVVVVEHAPQIIVPKGEDATYWHGVRLELWEQADQLSEAQAVSRLLDAIKGRERTKDAQATMWWGREVLRPMMAA